jgi:hypothetical protein
VFRSVLGRRPDIVGYQVRQTPGGADVDVVATSGRHTPGVAAALEAALTALGLGGPAVTVTMVNGRDRLATGTPRRFVPLPPG